MPDFAFILYGMNNRWNLHEATFWQWDKQAKRENYFEFLTSKLQLNKFFTIASQQSLPDLEQAKDTDSLKYREMLSEHGWDMFFSHYGDAFLKRWIAYDLDLMVRMVRRKNIIPVFLSYPDNRFPALNPLLKQIAASHEAPFIDLVMPATFYKNHHYYAEDLFHMNADGNRALAKRVIQKFSDHFTKQAIAEILQQKKAHTRCDEDTSAPVPQLLEDGNFM